MSPEPTSVNVDDEHVPATEAGEEARLEDVIPHQADAADSAPDEQAEESLDTQLEKAQATIKDYWDQMMRLRAEIDNNRKRADRDIENAHKYAIRGFVEDLLPVVDSMEMGQQAAAADNATLESIREGSQLTMDMLIQVLQKNGLERIDPAGEKFDPERHQAISMIDSDQVETGMVLEVMQKGFVLNERLVRPAMVVVAK